MSDTEDKLDFSCEFFPPKTKQGRENLNTTLAEFKSIDFNLLVSHLKRLKNSEIVEQPIYSFVTHNRTKDTLKTHQFGRPWITVDHSTLTLKSPTFLPKI